MELNNTTEKEISIRSIEPLTIQMLKAKIAPDISLAEFLSMQCAVIADGECQIYRTYDCSLFKRLKENRAVNEAHVAALMESFQTDGYLFTLLYVNEKLEIIDGQHRLEAAKRLGLPVYFCIMPGWGLKEVTMLNMYSRNWAIEDFMESHAKAGNPNYVRFKEFFDKHEFDITTCQLILLGRRSGGYAKKDTFRLGEMQLDDRHVTDAYLKAEKIRSLKVFHPHGWSSRNFVEAMLLLLKAKGYDHEHLISKLTSFPDILLADAKSLRVEEYLKVFVDKYNFRRIKERIEIKRK
jgi:hypothetical protein